MLDIERWLDDTQELANRLIEMEGAHHRAWGRHLLSDLRSLRLIAVKLSEAIGEEVDG